MNTLMRSICVAAALPLAATAQVPPAKPAEPAPPAPPAQPAPKAWPAPVPLPAKIPEDAWHLLERRVELLREHEPALMALQQELEFSPSIVELKHEIDFSHDLRQQMHALQGQLAQVDVSAMQADAQTMRVQAEAMKIDAEAFTHQIEMDFAPMKAFSEWQVPGMNFSGFDKPLSDRPRAPWASEDPADSLYRVAREALNRGEYRRAAQMFNELVKKYPRSEYSVDSQYWEAFARYRTGSTDDLREALRILDAGRAQFASLRRESNVDVQALRARVQAALAARGDARAAEDLKREASQANGGCDREEISVRAEALSALGQMDPAAAKPAVRRVLQRRDECTVELRRRALYLVGRNPDGDAASIIIDVARNDPNAGIRNEALRWLSRVAGDAAIPQLEEMLRTATDEQTQRAIVYALGSIDSDRSRRAIRALIERNDASERVRRDAINSLSREKEGRVNTEDMAYLRALYARLATQQLKEAVLSAVSRVGTPENEQFLLAIARNVNETPSLRAAALQRLGRMSTVSVADIAKLYDNADARSLREQILSALSHRKEPEAIDKMIDIGRRDTDPQIRRYAISLLSRSNNERAKQFIKEMFEQ